MEYLKRHFRQLIISKKKLLAIYIGDNQRNKLCKEPTYSYSEISVPLDNEEIVDIVVVCFALNVVLFLNKLLTILKLKYLT